MQNLSISGRYDTQDQKLKTLVQKLHDYYLSKKELHNYLSFNLNDNCML